MQVANQVDRPCDARRLEAAVRQALAGSAYVEGLISVAVVDDLAIHRLNKQYLEHDWPTDVLTFPLVDEPPRIEGEIVVSRDTADRAAADAGWSSEDELTLYVVHGALHLAGFDDHDPADAAEMRRREAEALDALGVGRSLSDCRWNGVTQNGTPEAEAS